jgi:hypothetical protein
LHPLEELDAVEKSNVDESADGGVRLAAVRVTVAVAAENLNSTAQETVAADLVVLGRADGVVAVVAAASASLDVGRSSDGSDGHGEDGGESRELHFDGVVGVWG